MKSEGLKDKNMKREEWLKRMRKIYEKENDRIRLRMRRNLRNKKRRRRGRRRRRKSIVNLILEQWWYILSQ
jgi:hypothetical protein